MDKRQKQLLQHPDTAYEVFSKMHIEKLLPLRTTNKIIKRHIDAVLIHRYRVIRNKLVKDLASAIKRGEILEPTPVPALDESNMAEIIHFLVTAGYDHLVFVVNTDGYRAHRTLYRAFQTVRKQLNYYLKSAMGIQREEDANADGDQVIEQQFISMDESDIYFIPDYHPVATFLLPYDDYGGAWEFDEIGKLAIYTLTLDDNIESSTYGLQYVFLLHDVGGGISPVPVYGAYSNKESLLRFVRSWYLDMINEDAEDEEFITMDEVVAICARSAAGQATGYTGEYLTEINRLHEIMTDDTIPETPPPDEFWTYEINNDMRVDVMRLY